MLTDPSLKATNQVEEQALDVPDAGETFTMLALL